MSLRFAKLDRAGIRKLQEGEQITEHGITAEKIGNGDVRWSVNVMVDGRRIHRVVGKESDRVTRTQCEDFIAQARADARADRLNLPQGRKLSLTFEPAAKDYLKRQEEGGGRNLVIKRRHMNKRLIPYFGAMRIDAISTFTIDKYKKRRGDEGAGNGTINRELATLSHFFRRCVEWKWLTHTARPKMLAESEGRVIALTNQQVDGVLSAAVKSADPDCWLFCAIGFNSSMRHTEIVSARWEYLDEARCRLWIPEAKGGQREQPITPQLRDILVKERASRDDQVGWIFPSPHKDSAAGHRARMGAAFREAVIAAGLDPDLVTPHVMRHTAITALVQAGADLPTIKRISGHKTLRMVERYTHVHGLHIDAAIRAIGRALPEPPQNETDDATTQELHRQRN